MATTPMATPRRSFAAAGSMALTSPGPGGCPFEVTMPRGLQPKKSNKLEHKEVRPIVIFVVGGPGSGKSTQCTRIAKQFRYVHLCIGHLLREEQFRPDSEEAARIEECIMQGALVPAELTVGVLMRAIERVDDWKHRKFVVDGFPREVAQVEAFSNIIGRKVFLKTCLYLDCSEAKCEERLLALAGSDSQGSCDEETVDRIRKRIVKFREHVTAVPRHFQYEGMLERIDSNREVDKVWVDVQQYFVVQGYKDDGGEPSIGSPQKAVWKLRDKQTEEIFPTGHSHTSTSCVKGENARHFSSYTILARHRDKHTRNMRSPIDNYVEAQTLAQEIGWHQSDDGEHIGAKGTPRGGTTPRSFYPRNTCSMTRHMENMYSTNAQHIIRRW